MILVYTSLEEIPKEILTDMKKHNLVKKNQLVFQLIPIEPRKKTEELESFTKLLPVDIEMIKKLTPKGKEYFVLS